METDRSDGRRSQLKARKRSRQVAVVGLLAASAGLIGLVGGPSAGATVRGARPGPAGSIGPAAEGGASTRPVGRTAAPIHTHQALLSVFQGIPGSTPHVSIDGQTPVSMAAGSYSLALVAGGTHTISVDTSPPIDQSFTLQAGTEVTALIYLGPTGIPEFSAFTDDRAPLPKADGRVVFHQTAKGTPVDIYLNGTRVVSDLANDPASPVAVDLTLAAGPVNLTVTPPNDPGVVLCSLNGHDLRAGTLLNVFVIGDPTLNPSTEQLLTNAIPVAQGYRMYASDGGVFDFGSAAFYGSVPGSGLDEGPVVGAAPLSVGNGYYMATAAGGVFGFDAPTHGSMTGKHLNKPIVAMADTPDDGGYWLAASDGGIFNFGDAAFHGSAGDLPLNKPIVGMAATPDGGGYWLVASDGGVFTYGDAKFYGSTGDLKLNKPIVGMAATVDGRGYWLVASDGGVFSFGDAKFYGSTGDLPLNRPIVGIVSTSTSFGYWLIASDGGVFSFGDATFLGSAAEHPLNEPVVFATAPGSPLPQ